MKKFSTLSCLLATAALASAAFILPGCGKSSKAPNGKQSSTQSAPKGEDTGDHDSEGQSSVVFYNNFLGFQGIIQSVFGKIGEALEKGEIYIGRTTSDAKPNWNAAIPPTSKISKIPALKFAAPTDFSKGNQNYINTRIESVKKDVDGLLKEVEAMKTYYKAEDFKDDWHKAFLMAKPRIIATVNRIAKNNKEILKLADQLSEETDRKNIAKSPDGIFILNMRYVIDKARDRADLILDNDFGDTRYGLGVPDEERREMLSKATPICDKIDALTKEIDKMCAEYKAIDRAVIKGSPSEKIYDGFFTSHEKSNEDIRRIIRELRERGYTNDQLTIGRAVSDLVSAHNKFLESRSRK